MNEYVFCAKHVYDTWARRILRHLFNGCRKCRPSVSVSGVSRTSGLYRRLGCSAHVGLAALIAAGLSGGIVSAITSKAGLFLSAFTYGYCLFIFSVWKGGSFYLLKETWSRSLLAFIIVGGALITVEQLRKAMYIMALAAVAILVFSVLFASGTSGRLAFIREPYPTRTPWPRICFSRSPSAFSFFSKQKDRCESSRILVTLMLLGMTLRTGSRSGLVSIAILSVYIFFSASVPKKFLMAR